MCVENLAKQQRKPSVEIVHCSDCPGLFLSIKSPMSGQNIPHRILVKLQLNTPISFQTLVPLVCVYFPYFCCITLTYLHLPVSVMAYLCFFLTSCFPAWDAIIIILLMSDYRHAVLNMLKRLRPTTIEGISQTSMVMATVPKPKDKS